MITNLLILGFFLLLVWLVVISIFYWQLYSHYNNVLRSNSGRGLKELLEQLLDERNSNKKDIAHLKQLCDRIEIEGKMHIQKIGLKRFNPFKDTGGDQSFILSLVDGDNTGVIISALYSRSGTRWYAKPVKQGKGIDHELSEEEKKALQNAN